jgi:Development and cell death domain
MFGRGIFGLPQAQTHDGGHGAAAAIVPGSNTIFLFNVTDRLLFGIFEKAMLNIVPTALSKNLNAQSSPFPVQVRPRGAG